MVSRWLAFCGVLTAALALAWAVGAPAQRAVEVSAIDKGYITTNTIVRWAAAHVSRLDPESQKAARYLSLHDVEPKERYLNWQLGGLVLNKISGYQVAVLPLVVPGTCNALLHFDIRNYQEDKSVLNPKFAAVFDRLGELGSGPAPFPEPYFHQITSAFVETPGRRVAYEEVEYERVPDGPYKGRRYLYYDEDPKGRPKVIGRVIRYRDEPGKREVNRVIKFGHGVDEASAIGLVKLTGTQFPIYTLKWFAFNALSEPRYHEFLLLDDTLASVEKLARVDRKASDRDGNTSRGVVLFSGSEDGKDGTYEVALKNRAIERFPSGRRRGRGSSFYITFDYKDSRGASNVMNDLLVSKADAHEIIFTLKNGLSGYFVTDGNGKRLDVAAGDIAQSHRLPRFKDQQVRTAYWCMFCHLSEKGFIEIDDEVTALSKKTVTLFADRFSKTDKRRGEIINQKYLEEPFNGILQTDQAYLEVALRAATRGLSPAEANRALQDIIWRYWYRPVTAEVLAWDVGYPPARVLQVIEHNPGLANLFTGIRSFRRQRRDQTEEVLALLMQALYASD